MKILPFLTAVLVMLFPYVLAMRHCHHHHCHHHRKHPDHHQRVPHSQQEEFGHHRDPKEPNGSLRMAIARLVERKGKDLQRVVRQLDNSVTKLEPNDRYFVHDRDNPLSREETTDIIYTQKFTDPGTYSLDHMFTKKLSTTWSWSREHNMDYILDVSQPVYVKVPDDSLVHVESLGKDFWEFRTPMSWENAEETCRAAGLKLAQPKTQKEVEELQKVLHKRIHNRYSGCQNRKWKKKNGYCIYFVGGFMLWDEAAKYCESINSVLPSPALGDVTAWQEAIKDSIPVNSVSHTAAHKVPDGQWIWAPDGEWEFWDDSTPVEQETWTKGSPSGKGDCSVIYPNTGKLIDKDCSTTWQTLCQGHSSSHWLGGIGSDNKCVEWVDGKCIEEEDTDPNSNMDDLWQTGQPGDLISPNYALQLQIENKKPFTLREITERRPFLCESACPLGFINLGPQCLLVKKVWLTWRDAQADCVKMGLQLYETKKKRKLGEFLLSKEITGTYWIGGRERSFAGKETTMRKIKKLPFICELADGTRKMNVTNQLSYSDQEKVILPKVVIASSNCTVTVTERTITETYPFSVQMDITGWIWVEYSKPTDEHGSNRCDNNNDWVSGEWCWAHSKWGYSTSYLHDGDQIMAQGDNARLTLNGTVTFTYNVHEVNITQPGSHSSRHSVRRKRSIASSEKSLKNDKNKANSQNNDDDNKPLMSQFGKHAGDWVRALAQERKAHLVAYTIDQLSPIVTDMVVGKEFSGLSTPGSIFEEEFINAGTESVITTFTKTKSVVNSYRYSVSKGLSIEDSHIASYSKSNTESASNTFSISNNIEETEGTSQSHSLGSTDSLSSSDGDSHSESIGSSNTERISASQSSSKGGTSSSGTSQTDSVGSTDSSSVSISDGSTSGRTQSTGVSDTISSSNTDTSSTSNTHTDTQTNTNTDRKTSTHGSSSSLSQSASNTQSNTITDQGRFSGGNTNRFSKQTGHTDSTSFGVTAGIEAKIPGFKKKGDKNAPKGKSNSDKKDAKPGSPIEASIEFSFKKDWSNSENTDDESTKTKELSSTRTSEGTNSLETSVKGEQTSTHEQSTASETSHTAEQSNTLGQTNTQSSSVGQDNTKSSDVSITHEINLINENTSTQDKTTNSQLGHTVENSINYQDTSGAERETDVGSSRDKTSSKTSESSVGKENRSDRETRINQERKKRSESSRGGDETRDSQYSTRTEKTRTHQVNLDTNEGVETSEEETLQTHSEIIIPSKSIVKIEWRVEHRKLRLPWKASIHLTGWINIRLKNNDQVCDMYHGSRWTYNYTSPCTEDNRLYGYPLSYLSDKKFIQQGEGLRFVASGNFEAVMVTSHLLRVTETALEDDDDKNNINAHNDEPIHSERRKRGLRSLPLKVTDYPLEFDEHGNAKANIGKKNTHFKRFQANRKLKKL